MSTTPNVDPRSMSRDQLMCFMRSNYSSSLDEDDFSILEKLKLNGETLLDGQITSAELMSAGLAMGPAKYFTLKIQELRSSVLSRPVRVRTGTDGKDGRQLVFHRPRSSTVDIHGSFAKYIIIFI